MNFTFSRASIEQKYILFERNATDLLKFVACLMVAMSHYCGYASVNGMGNPVYSVISANFGYLGVALFFLLSGYGLMMSDCKRHLSFVSFLQRRLSKTYLPAVLVSALWLGINMVINQNGEDLLSNQDLFLGVIWRFNDEVMWFVKTIIVLYLFFYFYRWIAMKVSPKIELLILIILTFMVTPLVSITHLGDPISVPLFFIGIGIARWPSVASRIFRHWTWLFSILIVILIVAYFGRNENRVLHGCINYLMMSVLIAFFAFFNIKIESLPQWVGGSSYDLYLVHYKTHLLLVYLFGIDILWMFLVGTFVTTSSFYNLRKLIRL